MPAGSGRSPLTRRVWHDESGSVQRGVRTHDAPLHGPAAGTLHAATPVLAGGFKQPVGDGRGGEPAGPGTGGAGVRDALQAVGPPPARVAGAWPHAVGAAGLSGAGVASAGGGGIPGFPSVYDRPRMPARHVRARRGDARVRARWGDAGRRTPILTESKSYAAYRRWLGHLRMARENKRQSRSSPTTNASVQLSQSQNTIVPLSPLLWPSRILPPVQTAGS